MCACFDSPASELAAERPVRSAPRHCFRRRADSVWWAGPSQKQRLLHPEKLSATKLGSWSSTLGGMYAESTNRFEGVLFCLRIRPEPRILFTAASAEVLASLQTVVLFPYQSILQGTSHVEMLESIASLQAAMTSGTLTSAVLVEKCLARIELADHELKAWVSIDSLGARSDAVRMDKELAQGQRRGVLHGIPIAIKDIVDVAGTVTGAGSPLRIRTEAPAVRDAPLVTALRRAGAIIIGKTVTTQFACFDPPPTRNPRALDRTPGGSSSGSAAAVATGMVPAAIGSQTGGSITRPASYCGVCGMKPTFQTVSLDGVIPVAPSLDHPGPIAGTVSDLRIMLQALTGTRIVETTRPSMSHLKLGRLRGFFEDRVAPELVQAMESAIASFSDAGATIMDIDVPAEFADVLVHHRRIMATEAASGHRDRYRSHREDYGPCIASLIEEGLRTPQSDYAASKNHQQTLTAAMAALFQESLDALLTPAAPGPAPDRSTTGDPCMNSPWSYTGQPTVSFPITTNPDQLPLAIQFAGPHRHDWRLLDVAEACEAVIRS